MVSLFGSSFANNLDLDGTRVYVVVTRSFAASPLISSWSSTLYILLENVEHCGGEHLIPVCIISLYGLHRRQAAVDGRSVAAVTNKK